MPTPNAATLNVQPRQRRSMYEGAGRLARGPLGQDPAGASSSIPEPELRETLRKLEAAGLAKRVKGTWGGHPAHHLNAILSRFFINPCWVDCNSQTNHDHVS